MIKPCSVLYCKRVATTKRLCPKHYARQWRTGSPTGSTARPKALCTVDNCNLSAAGKGLCVKHWARNKRTGTPMGSTLPTVEQRFFSLIEKTDTCWYWQGQLSMEGYGRFWDGTRRVIASRFSYQFFVGLIEDGYHIDHLCFNPPCVNPDHLEAVTPLENQRRRRKAEDAVH